MFRLGEFSRNVFVIATGAAAAQLISIGVSPVLTRLYLPQHFGVYTLFVSLTTFIGVLACGRYEFAITLPASHRDGLALAVLSTFISLVVAVALIPVVWLWGDQALTRMGQPQLSSWLWLLPMAIFLGGFATSARYWLLRTKAFRIISFNGVVRTGAAALLNIGFGVLGWLEFGLIGGLLLGLAVSAILLAVKIWQESSAEIRSLTWQDFKLQAHAQRRFPIYSLGSGVVESGASQIPVFFLSSVFGVSALGLFAMAQRTANLPLTLLASSVGDVFRQKASEVYARDGKCLKLFDQTFLKLFSLSIPSFALAACIAPWLFEFAFGQNWRESGEFVRYLSPALALRFISTPLSSMFYIAQRQHTDLVIQTILVLVMLGTFVWAGREGSGWLVRHTIIAYSGIYSLKYLVELVLSRKFARGEGVK